MPEIQYSRLEGSVACIFFLASGSNSQLATFTAHTQHIPVCHMTALFFLERDVTAWHSQGSSDTSVCSLFFLHLSPVFASSRLGLGSGSGCNYIWRHNFIVHNAGLDIAPDAASVLFLPLLFPLPSSLLSGWYTRLPRGHVRSAGQNGPFH